jgi:NAD(P)-dependent dehydrogenase (short-subunit alcohol dehydrogenase family)
VTKRLSARGDLLVGIERDRVVRHDDAQTLSPIDLGDPEATERALARIEEQVGPVRVVVHTVGLFQFSGPIATAPLSDFRLAFETHVMSTVHLLRAVCPRMVARGHGRVVVVASLSAREGSAGTSAYGASKAAELSVVQSVADELRYTGVTVNAVLPGTMDTPPNREAMPDADRSQWVRLDDVAELIACLTSPDLRGVTGEAVRIGRA